MTKQDDVRFGGRAQHSRVIRYTTDLESSDVKKKHTPTSEGNEAERDEKRIAQQTYCCCPVVNSANKLGGISNTMYSPAIYDSANETGTCCPLLSANCDEAVLMMLSARIEPGFQACVDNEMRR